VSLNEWDYLSEVPTTAQPVGRLKIRNHTRRHTEATAAKVQSMKREVKLGMVLIGKTQVPVFWKTLQNSFCNDNDLKKKMNFKVFVFTFRGPVGSVRAV
jgi:uncharacterized protein (DUF2252 family)